MFHYQIDGGDGRWLLIDECKGVVVLSTPDTQLSFAYDRECGTILKHGATALVQSCLSKAQSRLIAAGHQDMAEGWAILTVNSPPLFSSPLPGGLYMNAQDATACLTTSGYILGVIAKLEAIDVVAVDVASAPQAS